METIVRRLGTIGHSAALSVKHLGIRGAATLWKYKLMGRASRWDRLCTLRSPNAGYALEARLQGSDLKVFHQIFVEREYACLDEVENVDLVIDCGANVGYSSAYFLTRFPNCHVIAVEPDPDNFKMLEHTLAPYGGRARAVAAGVWSHEAPLVMSEEPYRDGGSWARQVRVCKEGETPTMQAVDIATLLKQSGKERISILKVDIEGAEAAVFAQNTAEWLDRVDNLVIELHHDSPFGPVADVFHDAISRHPFDLSVSGELTVCKRRSERPLAAAL